MEDRTRELITEFIKENALNQFLFLPVVLTKLFRRTTLFLLEHGVAKLFRLVKEPLKRAAQILVYRCQGKTVHFLQKGSFLFVLRGGGQEMRPGGGVKLLVVRQNSIPDVSAAAEGLVE